MRQAARLILLIVAALARPSAATAPAAFRASGFAFSGVSNRILTPNGDHLNDNVVFNCSNPFDSAGTVKIYDVRGHLVTTISIPGGAGACGPTNLVSWDGRAGGQVVSTGVYIYVIAIEGVVSSGTVVVIR
jgi:hypothetical protein